MGLPTVILSHNEDPIYSDSAWIVRHFYEMMGFKVKIAVLTHDVQPNTETFHYFSSVSTLPEFAQAKMIRFVLASQMGDRVCYIDDIDLYPLSKKFITDKTDQRLAGNLLCVGGEVYENNGCYPVSQMTAEGSVWKRFINPNNKTHVELFNEWTKAECMFDRREDMGLKLDWLKDDYFSDERLLRRLRTLNPVPIQELPRGYDNYLDATIDRHTHNKVTDVWDFDREKLKNHGYVNVHGVRPYSKYKHHYEPIKQYIYDNY